ncbi:hypothetical protein AB3Y40_11185 [Yoonia sp. R2331]|uniref:hypothetical protein n=1 Tax=Yoonia sp. R2331 TaxID=3237238 RepID=UPI0034E4F69E
MNRLLTTAALLALLAACDNAQPFTFAPIGDEVPVEDEDAEPVSAAGIPEAVGRNLETATYRAGGNFLSVQITSLDSTPTDAIYERNAALDVPGYRAFSQQEDPLDRIFIGMAQTKSGVTGVLVMDGGQFNKFFSGTYFEQNGAYSAHTPSQPNNGLVSYAGDYVGMLNLDAPRPNEALPFPAGVDPALAPGQASRVTGDIFINADFSDNTVNGLIYNREVVDFGNAPLDNVVLIVTEFDENGQFLGTVEDPGQTEIGSWAGTFGGVQASGIAGGIFIEEFIPTVENEAEQGLFVLTKCGNSGDAAICDNVNP